MGLDYCHLTWTIPPALLLTAVYWPFFTRLELYKILTLVTIAVMATIPWDAYLILHHIWSYPARSVVGPTLFAIPLEEVFFFVIQSYGTGLVYVILTKRRVLPVYLQRPTGGPLPVLGALAILCGFMVGAVGIWSGGRTTYMGLILVWVCPFMMLQWAMCCRFLLALPRKEILLAIGLPSLYLWLADNLALQRGTWVIEQDTKLNIQVWGSLDVEEATFFVATNILIVFGLVAIDHAIAIAEYQMASSPGTVKRFPSLGRLIALYISDRPEHHDQGFLRGLAEAVDTVSKKSQSMYMGSAMFQGGLRIDLLLLYSFCRVMDDLVDEAPDGQTAELVIRQCSRALKSRFRQSLTRELDGLENGAPQAKEQGDDDDDDDDDGASAPLHLSLVLLPVSRLSIDPLLDLLAGFKTDLGFSAEDQAFPIATEQDLERYAYNVAGSVAISVLELVFKHHQPTCSRPREEHARIIKAGERMGQALQYVNIARDIGHDAAIGRVYIPASWLHEQGLRPADVLAKPHEHGPKLTTLRDRLLDKADEAYQAAAGAIDELPGEVRGPVQTVVQSYMMIGRALRARPSKQAALGPGKLKLPLSRRLWVAWWAMCNA